MLETLITIILSVLGTWFYLKKNPRLQKDVKEIENEAKTKAYDSDIHSLIDDVVTKFGSDGSAKDVDSKKPTDPV